MIRGRRWVGGEDEEEGEEVAGLPGIHDDEVLGFSAILSYSILFYSILVLF